MDANIALLIGKTDNSILSRYLELVANRSLLHYRNASHLQWGKKEGESLYTHILSGIFVLDSLRSLLGLPEIETHVLFAAYTVHDINKFAEQQGAFNKLATQENIATELERLGIPRFFPQWKEYLADIEALVRSHGRSTHTSGELLIPKLESRYRLGRARILALRYLMKATDTLDLSHTLGERKHKGDFLDDLNTYLSESRTPTQYVFVTHRLVESRGLLTNVLHNAIAAQLENRYALVPLLFYPDGVAYLADREHIPDLGRADHKDIARTAAKSIKGLSQSKFRDFIKAGNQGIKVDRTCLEMGIPFAGPRSIWGEVYNIVQGKSWNTDSLESNTRKRAERDFDKHAGLYPETAEAIRAVLDSAQPIVPTADLLLRKGELVRTYYIFLSKHFRQAFEDVWTHLYELLEVPEEERPFYAFFDANYDRSYILGGRIELDENDIVERIAADGTELMAGADNSDPNIALLQAYLEQHCIFSAGRQSKPDFQAHLGQYVAAQHKQCVHCSSSFPTNEWMAGDVREDITVQVFSNRRRGGTGAPKKYVCGICQLQFLLEKLNYPAVRKEQLRYLHLFPYSFLTRPFIDALRTTFYELIESNQAITALNLDAPQALAQWLEETAQQPVFRTKTKQGKPQPYGMYVPRYSELTGNLLIFPLNPAGKNDTQQFLFALWNALVIQRHFGMKVLLSAAPVPPLDKQDFGDLYVDNIPLGTQGLLPENNYRQFKPGEGNIEDSLPTLWQKTAYLQRLRELTFNGDDNTPRLVKAITAHPLMIFHETDRLLLAKASPDAGGLDVWLYQQAFEPVNELALSTGGPFMQKLSSELKKAAAIAVQHNLRGSSFERSSLLYPFNEVMQKLALDQEHTAADRETLRAAATQDIYDHLDRLATRAGYKMTKARADACAAFVDCWFDDILNAYEGQSRKLIADEKLLRSAYLFYVRQSQADAKEDRS